MYGNDDAAGQPHPGIRGEVKRLVGDAHVHRLVVGEAGARQRIAHRAGGGEELSKAHPWKGLARGKALRSLSEERAEIQARREIEKAGGWRSDCATTQ
jgi:hypothetical protein